MKNNVGLRGDVVNNSGKRRGNIVVRDLYVRGLRELMPVQLISALEETDSAEVRAR